ncbi:winged helix DNA-binding domain-containing protein [Kribbella sp. CA-293567]|uniref:winged helix DNA-binding domain-containing protein n=1 Tax=Kribbella sp. CA-293567 TaxID=3002436 RepID=UPI0022DCF841|nr:winged helix DNA-binding domain-containing protein [Kribbella sp. CA-293567]WBQ08068.1 winged helix DNA-binding domain-containing protein [Kribbella sp. CA-293567]
MKSVSWQAVVARRMTRHHLNVPATGTPTDVVRGMAGAHAQVLSAAEISVALRLEGGTREHVQQALWGDRSLVKTFGPRGTVHLLPTDELASWVAALSALPGPVSSASPAMRMTPEQTAQVIAAVGDALAEDDLTVDELSDEVIGRTGSWAGDLVMPAFQGYWPRWRQAISAAANAGVLCYGPNRGRNTTYTNPHRFAPFEAVSSESALSDLVRRFLWSYGPATSQHFAKWLSVSPTATAKLFTRLADELEKVLVDDRPAWLLRGDTEFTADRARGVRLLPYFDAYGVGSHPRELLFPGKAWDRALARGQAGNYPLLLVDGIVAGVWHQRRSGRKLRLTVETLGDLRPRQLEQLDAEAERLGEISNAQPQLTLGEVSVGPHA